MSILATVKDKLSGKIPKGKKRSKNWRKVRREHLKNNPICAICHGKKKLEVHHIIPFHLAPELEEKKSNLITLCERKKYGINCHLLVGHLGNYRRANPNCSSDVMVWNRKIKFDGPLIQKALEKSEKKRI